MTVPNTNNKDLYDFNGVTTEWAITFPINGVEEDEILVYLTDTNGVSALVEENYTVDLVTPQVVYPSVVSGLDPFTATMGGVTIVRELDLLQGTDLKNFGALPAEVIEKSLDRLAMSIIQIQEQINRTNQADISQDSSDVEDFISSILETAQDCRDAALASANAAAASAIDAAASVAECAAHVDDAAASVAECAAHVDDAAASVAECAAYVDDVIASANQAAASADAAEISANQAATTAEATATAIVNSLLPTLNSTIKAWINFNGAGTIAIKDSFNVTSIGDNGTGDYTITWDTDFATVNYCAVGNVKATSGNIRTLGITTQAVGSLRVLVKDDAGTACDVAIVNVIAIGDQ